MGGGGVRYPCRFSRGKGWILYEHKSNYDKEKPFNRKQFGGWGGGDQHLWKKNKFWFTSWKWRFRWNSQSTEKILIDIMFSLIYFLPYCDCYCINISHESDSRLSVKYKHFRNFLYMLLSLLFFLYMIFFFTNELQSFKTSTRIHITTLFTQISTYSSLIKDQTKTRGKF